LFAAFSCLFLSNLLALALPWAVKIIVDDVLPQKNSGLLFNLVLALGGIIAARSFLAFGKQYLADLAGERIIADIRRNSFAHIHNLSLAAIDRLSPAQIMARLTRDVEGVRRFIFGDALDFIYAVLNFGVIVTLLMTFNAQLTLVALLTLPLFAAVYLRFIPELKAWYQYLGEGHNALTARMNEVVNGMRTVRVLGAQPHEQRLFDVKQRDILALAARTHLLSALLWIGIEFFTSVGIVAVLWQGGNLVIAGELTAGELVAFYAYLGMLFAPILRMTVISSSFQEARSALERINGILQAPTAPDNCSRDARKIKLRGKVEFRDVSFGYSAGERVLEKISFTVEPGEVVGIVGASGAGKTTLINLLLRLYDPEQGGIFIDDRELRELDAGYYRRQLAVVLQDEFLFKGSVRENILYGTFDAGEERVVAAARAAQAQEFITQLRDKYDTALDERGLNLSGGQRQRLAIARALVRDPALLIMDEATCAVDALTENLIQRSIRTYLPRATIFMVAHRFSTIMEADRIVVLEKGRIAEVGGHEQLLKAKGFYRRLYDEQFKAPSGPGCVLAADETEGAKA